MTASAPPSRVRAAAAPVWALWRDTQGRLSTLRVVTLLGLVLPLMIAGYDYATVGFGPRVLNNVIHRSGYWALVFLLVSLAITPLRRIGRFGKLLDVRRMIGVAAFFYAALHLVLYVADQRYDLIKVATEIALRLYLTIGFVALIGLGVLALTSTDAMVRRLGPRWQVLHQVTYLIASLALIHYFQQTKADVWVPTFVAGLFAWLIGYRLMIRFKTKRGELSSLALAGLAAAAAIVTFAGETIGLSIAFKAPPLAVLQSALEFEYDSIRPGWLILAAGLAVAAINLLRGWMVPRQRFNAPP